uniref:Ig-like domain-containing protein n=1 Tax=Myripristis murdjan TaxID=586833 RepID=A0A667ZGC6_9TELE
MVAVCVVNFSVLGLFFHRPLAPNLNQNLKARPGHNITLSCQAPDGVDITVAEWRRTDLKELEPVFLYRDGHIDSENQHPSFKNRVELIDGEMKNGNLSVILKNVTEYDNGTYECPAGAKRMKRAIIPTDPFSIIKLEVVLLGGCYVFRVVVMGLLWHLGWLLGLGAPAC